MGRTHYHYKPTNDLLETTEFIFPINPSPTQLFDVRVLISFAYLTNVIYNSSRNRVRDPLTIKISRNPSFNFKVILTIIH